MGLTIHYSGRIADKNKLPQLIEEVEEIATVHGWKYSIYEQGFPRTPIHGVTSSRPVINNLHDGKLYGIEFTPEGSEPVSICFLSNGRMSGIMQLTCWGQFREEKKVVLYNATINEHNVVEIQQEEETLTADDYNRYLYMCSSKTQYAGPGTHVLIIGVFRYLAKTYLADFEMIDEAQFWETNDTELLENQFARTGFLIDSFGLLCNIEKHLPDEDIESYILRIIAKMRKK